MALNMVYNRLETKPPKPPTPERRLSSPAGGVYTPYTDNPSPIARDENEDPGIMLQEQRRVMEGNVYHPWFFWPQL